MQMCKFVIITDGGKLRFIELGETSEFHWTPGEPLNVASTGGEDMT